MEGSSDGDLTKQENKCFYDGKLPEYAHDEMRQYLVRLSGGFPFC
jgi:hypothetical protein